MFNKKLKKFASLALAAVVAFGSVQEFPVSEIKAFSFSETTSKGDTSNYLKKNFADAVQDFYDGKIIGLNGNYEIANFKDNYEYSVSHNGLYKGMWKDGDLNNSAQASNSCFSETSDKSSASLKNPQSIKYVLTGQSASLNHVTLEKSDVSSITWSYDIVQVEYAKSMGGYPSKYYAVNIKPVGSTAGEITLPAYINAGEYGYVECAELADGAFLKEDVTKVHIPDTYQRICAYAFTGCEKLTAYDFVTVKLGTDNKSYTISGVDEEGSKSKIHMVGSGAFAGCKSLTSYVIPSKLMEGYSDGKSTPFGYFEDKGHYTSDGGYEHIILNENINQMVHLSQSTGYAKDGCDSGDIYFMGQGVFRDCYAITSVTLKGKNVFVPALTFAGCAAIKELNVDKDVSAIYFGTACFSGADGNRPANETSNLKQLALSSEKLEKVYFGAYCFKKCVSLHGVSISASVEPCYAGSKVQDKVFHGEGAFEGAFAPENAFIFSPNGAGSFTFATDFFKDSKLERILFKENSDDSNKFKGAISINSNAFNGVSLEELNLVGSDIYLYTGAFYNSSIKSLKLEGYSSVFTGEPFSGSLTQMTTDKGTSFDKIEINTQSFSTGSEKIVDCKAFNGTGMALHTYETNASFYGLDSNTLVSFGENCTKCDFGESFSGYLYYKHPLYYNINEVSSTDVSHNYLGGLTKIFFKNPDTHVTKLVNNHSGKNTTLYCDGSLYDTTSQRKDITTFTVEHYKNKLQGCSVEWVTTVDSFDSGIVNDGKGLVLNYADGGSEYVSYAEKEQNTNAISGTSGYIIQNIKEVLNALKSGAKSVDMQVAYLHLSATIHVTFVPQQAISMTVASAGSVVANTEPKASDVVVTDIKFNDKTTLKEALSNEVSVKLANGGIRYAENTNTVAVTYKGYTSECVVFAVPEEVVTMSAIQLKDNIYVGDRIDKTCITVLGTYNSGKGPEALLDYEITNPVVKEDGSVTIKSSNGVELVAKLNVIQVKPKKITVSYNGNPVVEGGVVDKDNFTVTLINNNGSSRVLESNEFDLLYSDIIANASNSVEVIFKEDEDITATAYVTGIVNPVTEIPATEEPEVEITNSPVVKITESPVVDVTESPVVDVTESPAVEITESPVVSVTGSPATKVTDAPGNVSTEVTDAPKNSSSPTVIPTNSNTPTASPITQVLNIGPNPSAVATGAGATVTGTEENKEVTLGLGEKIVVKMNGTGVTFVSSDSNVVEVDSTGLVTTKGVGTAQITATNSNNDKVIITVNVKKAPKKVKVNFKKKTLKKGKSIKIRVSFAKGYYSYTRKFSSSNKKVATVNSKGVIKAKKKGKAKITVKTFNGKKAVIQITVK